MPKTKWVQTNKDNTQKEAINFSFVEWKNLTAEGNNCSNCVELTRISGYAQTFMG